MIRFLLFLIITPLAYISNAQTVKYAEVKTFSGRPRLLVNGKPVVPDFYALTHAYGGRWSWEEVPSRNIQNFCAQGIRLYQVDLYLEDIWKKGTDTLDIAKAQKQVRGILDVCLEAGVVIRIHVNAPYWWNELHPEECTAYADGPVDKRTYGPPFNNEDGDVDRPLRASLASLRWRKEAGERLKEFAAKLSKTAEGNAVIGFHIAGGIYGEWHYWGFIDHDPDIGPAMTAYFRNWLKSKYGTVENLRKAWNNSQIEFEQVRVPGLDERDTTSSGIFRDPAKERRVIDYFMSQQQVVAEDIEYFCRLAKENWPRPLLTGVFYGYIHMTFCRQASGGHLAVEQILNSPYVDYLSGPASYWSSSREVGGSGNPRGVIESTLLHGKLWLDEMDNGFMQKNTGFDNIRVTTEPDSVYLSLLERNSILPLMRGAGLWYYDFGLQKSFGWWDRPLYLEKISKIKSFFDRRLDEPEYSDADVLYVWDMAGFYYVANKFTPVCYDQLDKAFEESARSGTVGDHIFLFDLFKVDLKKYKAIVFMNTYKITEEERNFIVNKVAKNGRTLIWNYLPGFTDGKKLSIDFVRKITGFNITLADKWNAPVVQVKNSPNSYTFSGAVRPLAVITDGQAQPLGFLEGTDSVVTAKKTYRDHTEIYSTLPLHLADQFRDLFRAAGCHVYNDSNDFTYEHSGLLLLHTKEGGKRLLHLRNGKEIRMEFPPHSTTLLDGETGKMLLE